MLRVVVVHNNFQSRGNFFNGVTRHCHKIDKICFSTMKPILLDSGKRSVSEAAAAATTTTTSTMDSVVRKGRKIGKVKMWCDLTKIRLSAMVVLSSGCGYFLAGPPFTLSQLVFVTGGTALAAASASVFNQVYERKTDAMMKRTSARALPAGHISTQSAVVSGIALGVSSVGVLAYGTNPLVAGLGLANILLYAGVYTPLKQKTEWNTWVGAVVGAIPPVMGYAAATNTVWAPEPLLLGAGLFFWQFPHFFALSWLLKKDYTRGGHKMVPCADPTGVRTGRLLTSYAAVNALIPFAAYATNATTVMYPIESILFNGYNLYLCRRFQRGPSDENARKVFLASLWYLPVFMGLFVLHGTKDRRSDKRAGDMILLTEQHGRFYDSYNDLRDFLKKLCIHEYFVSPSKEHTAYCPVTSTELKIEESKAIMEIIQNRTTVPPVSSR